jgi:prepilin-type N-terminal cleavage/methylation domain-containing protein
MDNPGSPACIDLQHLSDDGAIAMSGIRPGYTLTEMVTVMVIFGVATGLGMPRLQGVTSSAGLRSARTQTMMYVAQARSLALQRGREARFVRSGDVIKVTVDSSGTQVVYSRPHDLKREHGVSILSATTRDTIAFDPRGFAVGTGSVESIRLTRGGMRDSVCVTKFGKVIMRGCSL